MSITIDMPADEIDAIKRLTHLDNDGEAVLRAAREYMRLIKLRELKGASGKVEFEANWQQLEDLELGETMPPGRLRGRMNDWVFVDTCIWASFFGKPASAEKAAVDARIDA